MLVWWIASLSAVRYETGSSSGTCAQLDVPSFIMIDECIEFNDTTGRIVLSSSETMEVSEEGGVMKLQPRNHNNSIQTRFYYLQNETEIHASRPENAYLYTYSYDPDEIPWEEILGVNTTAYCTLVKEWIEGGPCTTDPNAFPVSPDTHSYLDFNNWFQSLAFTFNPKPEPVFNHLIFGGKFINEEDGTFNSEPGVYCYALKSNGKCDGSIESPPNSFSYRNWAEGTGVRTLFDFPTTLAIVNVLTFDHPVQHEQLEKDGCIHSMNISLQDGAYMFHYSGPTHYTDMYMNPVTKIGERFDWKNYSICMETETRVVAKFEFQDDLHTLRRIAYDPVVSFQALSPPPPSPSTPLPSLPPPSSPSPPSASLWFVPMLIIFLLACTCITASASLQRLSRTF